MDLNLSLSFNQGLQSLAAFARAPDSHRWLCLVFSSGWMPLEKSSAQEEWWSSLWFEILHQAAAGAGVWHRESSAGEWKKYQKDKAWPAWAWSYVSSLTGIPHTNTLCHKKIFFFVLVSLCLIQFQKASKNKKHTYIECGPMCVLFLHFWTIVS